MPNHLKKQIITCKLCRQRFALRMDPDALTTMKGAVTKLAQHLMSEHPEHVCNLILSQFDEQAQPQQTVTTG